MITEEKNGLLFLETAGISMRPFLMGGEKLIVKRTPLFDLRLGDLILYRISDQLICHRLIKKTKVGGRWFLYIRPDASLTLCDLVSEEMFMGRVIGVIKNNKEIGFDGIRQRVINRIIVIAGPLAIFMVRIREILLRRR